MLLDSGWGQELQLQFGQLFSQGRPPPPASARALDLLETFHASHRSLGQQCPICLIEFEHGVECIRLGCQHHFHKNCIVQWLKQTNSCPVCRFELETDDVDYEEWKRQQRNQKQKEETMKELHNSMYS